MNSVIHIALTPLAGSPIRLVRALNKHQGSSWKARLVTLNQNAYGKRTFPGDLSWQAERDTCIQALKQAAIIHFHHYFDPRNNDFDFDFTRACPDALFVRHLHTHPLTLAFGDHSHARRIVASSIPQLTTAQFHERYYPKAHPIRNPVELSPSPASIDGRKGISFAPSVPFSAWSSRWDTKGSPEVEQTLKKVRKVSGEPFVLIKDLPFEKCLALKATSLIGVDDVVTGSYHISSLEYMAMGIPAISMLDARLVSLTTSITGSNELPWINVGLDDLYSVLLKLTRNKDLLEELGHNCHAWMLQHWHPQDIAKSLVEHYETLLAGNWSPRTETASRAALFLSSEQFDLPWLRKRRRISARWSKSKHKLKTTLHLVRNRLLAGAKPSL